MTVGGTNFSLEAGGSTLDVGTERFAMPTGVTNGSAGLLIFEGGGTAVEVSLISVLLCGIAGSLVLIVRDFMP